MGFYIKSMPNKHTMQEFIEKSKLVHGSKYDYSKVEYISTQHKVIIVCSTHGDFLQLPFAHRKGHGCSKCGFEKTSYKIKQITKIGKAKMEYENIPDNCKAVPLSNGKYSIVDEEDYDKVMLYNWYHTKGYANSHIDDINKSLHHFILKYDYKKGDKYVDHINGDGLDNRKSNLRFCTHQQNQMNSRGLKGSFSKYKGVFKYSNKYRASITHNRKMIHLGVFDTEIEASLAYDKKAVELFGYFAKLNKNI